jgi:hypothetical protein
MIDLLLPTQYPRRAHSVNEPHKRLMAAVLQAVVDDCRGSAYRRARGCKPRGPRPVRQALAYVASRDRTWPFSFENLCEALDLNAEGLRRQLRMPPVVTRTRLALPSATTRACA